MKRIDIILELLLGIAQSSIAVMSYIVSDFEFIEAIILIHSNQ